jgi:hypothetical protein
VPVVTTRRFGLLSFALVACVSPREERVPRPTVIPAPEPPPVVASSAAALVEAGPVDPASEATFVLPIADRAQAKESPPAGWCGETAIQEGLLHLGVWAPQRVIHRAGKPSHPDLYATDIPVALTTLGVRQSFYGGPRGYEPFARWARTALEAGDPVLAGVKILPTAHPDWGLDHFVLVVGHGKRGLLVNTTWSTREWAGDTVTPGLSLKGAFYGIRLHGLMRASGTTLPARLTLLSEDAETIRLAVRCVGASAGARYRIERRGSGGERNATETVVGLVGATESLDVTIPTGTPARFQCTVPPG